MDVLTSLGAGILAGLGVAAPLGAIGILLLREGLTAGFRAGAPAAFAVAVVDAAYCALAVLAGAAAGPLLAAWGALPAMAGGTALLLLGLTGAWRTWRAAARPVPGGTAAPPSSNRRRFLLFLTLTAVNPMTLLYFAALAAGLRDLLALPAGPAAFTAGVALGSAGWQLGLVFAGAFLRGRMTASVQRAVSLAGHAAVAALGAAALFTSVTFA